MAIIAATTTLGSLIPTQSRAAARERAEACPTSKNRRASACLALKFRCGSAWRAPKALATCSEKILRGIWPRRRLTRPVLAPSAIAVERQVPNRRIPQHQSTGTRTGDWESPFLTPCSFYGLDSGSMAGGRPGRGGGDTGLATTGFTVSPRLSWSSFLPVRPRRPLAPGLT